MHSYTIDLLKKRLPKAKIIIARTSSVTRNQLAVFGSKMVRQSKNCLTERSPSSLGMTVQKCLTSKGNKTSIPIKAWLVFDVDRRSLYYNSKTESR